ncbi:MAG: DUF72 domain-containing protein [Planctomycetota bacterium]
MTGHLRFGTSSWSEKSWSGVFYPEGLLPGDWLGFYATQFDTVEADVTYYRVPDARLVDGWRAKTPEGFEIAAKFPRSIVHAGDGARPDGTRIMVRSGDEDDTGRFLTAMRRLGSRCGPLVLQFPYLAKDAFAKLDPFLERLAGYLDALPKDFRYAVEIRNRTWLAEPLLALLRERNVALVLVDLLYMPHPADVADELDVVTADFTYGRLIGDRKAVDDKTKTFDRIVIDQGERLDRWATLLRHLLEVVPEAYVYANNHYAGHGPASIRDLVARTNA